MVPHGCYLCGFMQDAGIDRRGHEVVRSTCVREMFFGRKQQKKKQKKKKFETFSGFFFVSFSMTPL
jgi:hypothetical protein